MDSALAFTMGMMNRGKELMVFDWDKAAEIIKKEKPLLASAGLCNDWEWTGGDIYCEGKPLMDEYTYLASTWAVPELLLNGYEVIPCYRMKSETPNWDFDTKWPQSALDILNS